MDNVHKIHQRHLIYNVVYVVTHSSRNYGVGGVKVSIVAFQAIDPGSIPG